MRKIKGIYRILRSVIFSAIVTMVAFYLILYILLSVPYIQNRIKLLAQKELTLFLGGDVNIGTFRFYPFNEAVLKDVVISDPTGEECIKIGTLGAGIRLWRLISKGEIEITYAELINSDFKITQANPESALNIQFLIDAFKPKDKNKPPTLFDLKIHNIVLRRCNVSYDKLWMPLNQKQDVFDSNHLHISDLSADLALPQLKNDDFVIDLRRLGLRVGDFRLDKLQFRAHLTPKSLSLSDVAIILPQSDIRPSDIAINFNGYSNILDAFKSGFHSLVIADGRLTPDDLSYFAPQLKGMNETLWLNVDITGNMSDIEINRLHLNNQNQTALIELKGKVRGLKKTSRPDIMLDNLSLRLSQSDIHTILSFFPSIPDRISDIVKNAGDIKLDLSGFFHRFSNNVEAQGYFEVTNIGNLEFDVSSLIPLYPTQKIPVRGRISSDGILLGEILSVSQLGRISFDVQSDMLLSGSDFSGSLTAEIPFMEYNGTTIEDIFVEAEKNDELIDLNLNVDDSRFLLAVDAEAMLAGPDSSWHLVASSSQFNPSLFVDIPYLDNVLISATIECDATGNSLDNLVGKGVMSDLHLSGGDTGEVSVTQLEIISLFEDESHRYEINSDFISGYVEGDFKPTELPQAFHNMLAGIFPEFIYRADNYYPSDESNIGEFRFNIFKNKYITDLLNLPLEWLTDFELYGSFTTNPGTLNLYTTIPYIKQGKNKLIRDTYLQMELDEEESNGMVDIGTVIPVKNGDLQLKTKLTAFNGALDLMVYCNPDRQSSFNGVFRLGATLYDRVGESLPGINLHVYPGSFTLNGGLWEVSESDIRYYDKTFTVDDLRIQHDSQYLIIDGAAGGGMDDVLYADLSDIDLNYIFDTLNINYVTFGGNATGRIYARDLFSDSPVASVETLKVSGLTYNGSLLGDADLKASWRNADKCVSLGAEIDEDGRHVASLDGGIYVTRDSLALDFDVDKLNIGFLQPFMATFATEVKGRASGNAHLFGTFKDIDLAGNLYADSISVKIGYTNVAYSGSDSVIITPGHIDIPRFRLYDRNGNYGYFQGELSHTFFREPYFDFRLTEASNLLCYDTNKELNPDWWGEIYGTGSAVINGKPDLVTINANMTTERNSSFTFVLNDSQNVEDYKFLSFTDIRKESAIIETVEEEPDFLQQFKKSVNSQSGPKADFLLDIRADITPNAEITLVMDPSSGDKIKARGTGNLNIGYGSITDEMTMYGKYTLAEGVYNFSLQELILRDFSINEGSTISFNGDPMDALLDITAAYRVNTNLTDLDKSFANDKELNRTSVPVDALLKVSGELQNPNISFDISLPTLTEETGRKVRSIISTEDMMSRQIIYLLALNRFYTPEYMGATSNGGEWASVASSTISSQLSNMLGQLTDKVNVMPSLRSDKGDFSDVEVDVALSSRLLNNRLLLNGNFGYRDRTTSNTTFVGDFDIEYLLNPNGNLRLKAYNHFNDQNYYLKSSLTTQGIGLVFKREFNNPFTFLKSKRK